MVSRICNNFFSSDWFNNSWNIGIGDCGLSNPLVRSLLFMMFKNCLRHWNRLGTYFNMRYITMKKVPTGIYPLLVGLLIKLRLIKFTSSMKLLEPFGTWKFNKTAIMRFLRTVLCMEGQWEFLLLKAEFIIRLYIGSRIRKQSSFF